LLLLSCAAREIVGLGAAVIGAAVGAGILVMIVAVDVMKLSKFS
jgi:hypothetical protein